LYGSIYLTYFIGMRDLVNTDGTSLGMVNQLDLSPLDEALALLHFGFRAVVAEPDRILARRGLGRLHHRILFFVARQPGLRMSELLALLGISKQALHGPMRQLVARDLVHSRVDPQSRRSRCLRLSRSGAALEEKLSSIQRELFAQAFAAAGPQAERGFRAVLAKIIRPLASTAPQTAPPTRVSKRRHAR